MTTALTDSTSVNKLSWRSLHEASFGFNQPFDLALHDDQIFSAEHVVRLIPKRRMVVFGTWQGKPVVAKLFFHALHAKAHMEKEIAGVSILKKNKIPTPELYYQGSSEDRRIYVLLFERITEARNLEEAWLDKTSLESFLSVLQAVILELATQHVLGVLQLDLHLKNFLLTEKNIYTLDGAEIKLYPPLMPKKESTENLALFISQLGALPKEFQEKLFEYYAKARGWIVTKADRIHFFLLIKRCSEMRWQKFQKKIFRNATDFLCFQLNNVKGMVDKRRLGNEMLAFLQNPEAVFQSPNEFLLLKAGRSSTVIKVRLDNKDYVVKRYNMKNARHRFRRFLRWTRAKASWRLAQKLILFGIPTAYPVAYIEKKYGSSFRPSYFVTEFVEGKHLGQRLNAVTDEVKQVKLIKQIALLLQNTAKLEISHGDLKVANILINSRDEPLFIDLDGAKEHATLSGLRKAWKKEVERFLRNFEGNDELLRKFEVAIRS